MVNRPWRRYLTPTFFVYLRLTNPNHGRFNRLGSNKLVLWLLLNVFIGAFVPGAILHILTFLMFDLIFVAEWWVLSSSWLSFPMDVNLYLIRKKSDNPNWQYNPSHKAFAKNLIQSVILSIKMFTPSIFCSWKPWYQNIQVVCILWVKVCNYFKVKSKGIQKSRRCWNLE